MFSEIKKEIIMDQNPMIAKNLQNFDAGVSFKWKWKIINEKTHVGQPKTNESMLKISDYVIFARLFTVSRIFQNYRLHANFLIVFKQTRKMECYDGEINANVEFLCFSVVYMVLVVIYCCWIIK